MLKKLKFPSFYTRIVDVDLNGNIYKSRSSRRCNERILERNKFTETVILKANDFRFYLSEDEKKIYEKFYTEAFVIDNNNFLKNNISNFIASEAISFRTNKNFDDRVFNEISLKQFIKSMQNMLLERMIVNLFIYLTKNFCTPVL